MPASTAHNDAEPSNAPPFDPAANTRPDPSLWTYYIIISAFTLFGFPFVIWPMYFKYKTLKYRFDDKGIAMSWGMLWRREIYLTYRRIQDIHVTRGLIQRWLGLATVSVQTASVSAGSDVNIEGIRNPGALRDFLYSKMRGVKDHPADSPGAALIPLEAHAVPGAGASGFQASNDEALAILHDIRDELRRLRTAREGGVR